MGRNTSSADPPVPPPSRSYCPASTVDGAIGMDADAGMLSAGGDGPGGRPPVPTAAQEAWPAEGRQSPAESVPYEPLSEMDVKLPKRQRGRQLQGTGHPAGSSGQENTMSIAEQPAAGGKLT